MVDAVFSRIFVVSVPVLTISNFLETNYRAKGQNLYDPARITDCTHAGKIFIMAFESRCAAQLDAFSVVEKKLLSDRQVSTHFSCQL